MGSHHPRRPPVLSAGGGAARLIREVVHPSLATLTICLSPRLCFLPQTQVSSIPSIS